MKYVEWINGKENLFDLIAEKNPTGVVATVGVDLVKMNYLLKFGQREIPSSVVNLSVEQIAEFIHGMYDSKWENIYISMLDQSLNEFDSEITIEENRLGNKTTESTNNNINKVSAFNDDEFDNDNKTDHTSNESGLEDNSRSYTERKKSIYSFDKRRRMMENETIETIICLDVSKVLGLAIY